MQSESDLEGENSIDPPRINWCVPYSAVQLQSNNIHLLDRTSPNIIFIWSSKVILGEANKCLIFSAHAVCTRSIARFIDPDQEAIY